MTFQIKAEYISKLDLHENSVILLKKPDSISAKEAMPAMVSLQKYAKQKTGFDCLIIALPADTELIHMDEKSLIDIRTNIDSILAFLASKKGDHSGVT